MTRASTTEKKTTPGSPSELAAYLELGARFGLKSLMVGDVHVEFFPREAPQSMITDPVELMSTLSVEQISDYLRLRLNEAEDDALAD